VKKSFTIGLGLLAIAGAASAGTCKDPWVTRAIQEVKGRAPQGSGSSGECDIHRYGGGRWSSYEDLRAKVKTAFGMNIAGSARPGQGGNGLANGRHGVAGGNVVAPGGGNVVAPGGANVVAPGGANLMRR
jgi:hypothetical protein